MPGKINFPYQSIQPIGLEKTADSRPASNTSSNSFKSVLENEINSEVKFSKHAQERLKSRNIELNEEKLQKLQEAVGKARAKGSRDSLILMDNLALVVSIRNNTVITAIDGVNIQENVFTKIDSAVII